MDSRREIVQTRDAEIEDKKDGKIPQGADSQQVQAGADQALVCNVIQYDFTGNQDNHRADEYEYHNETYKCSSTACLHKPPVFLVFQGPVKRPGEGVDAVGGGIEGKDKTER